MIAHLFLSLGNFYCLDLPHFIYPPTEEHLGRFQDLEIMDKALAKIYKSVPLFIYAFECPVVPASFVGKVSFAPLYCLCFFAKNQLNIFM